MWSISATIFSCVFCFMSLCLHTLPLFHLERVDQNIFVCNNRLNSSYPFSSKLLSIWECSNPQMLSESNQLTICSNSSFLCLWPKHTLIWCRSLHRVWNCSCFFTFYKPIPSSTFLAVNTTVVDLSFIIFISYSVLPKESHPIDFWDATPAQWTKRWIGT